MVSSRNSPGFFALALGLDNLSSFPGEVVAGALEWAADARLTDWVQVFKLHDERLTPEGVLGMAVCNMSQVPEKRAGYPVINVSNSNGPYATTGNLINDDVEIGRMAARHLIERGHREFLAARLNRGLNGRERIEGFLEIVRQNGREARVLVVDPILENTPWSRFPEVMESILRPHLEALPMDGGIFAMNDWLAVLLQRTLADHFPERAHTTAVIGVDNSSEWGHPGSLPGLTTVLPDFRGIGRATMAWLAAHPGPEHEDECRKVLQRFPPLRVIERASTAGGACADPMTARIARWAWQQVRREERVSTDDMARQHGMSRRSLDRRFSEHIGKPAGEFLHDLRLNYARLLILETDYSIADISERCGFSKQSGLSRAIREAEGCSPREFRAQRRAAGEFSGTRTPGRPGKRG